MILLDDSDVGCMGDSQDPDRNHCWHELSANVLVCCFCGEETNE